MKNLLKAIVKYLPDILMLLGIWIFVYNVYFPISTLKPIGAVIKIASYTGHNYSGKFKFIGIILLTLGIDIAIRRYLVSKNKS